MTDRLIPRMPPDSGIAGRLSGRLLDLAEQVRRLDPPARHDPDRFQEAKTELAGQLTALAWDARERLGAARCSGFRMAATKSIHVIRDRQRKSVNGPKSSANTHNFERVGVYRP